MLSGKAYAKAIRAHFLIQPALVQTSLMHYLATSAEGSVLESVVIDGVSEQFLASSVPKMCMHDAEALYEQILTDRFVQLTQCDSIAILNQLLECIKSIGSKPLLQASEVSGSCTSRFSLVIRLASHKYFFYF